MHKLINLSFLVLLPISCLAHPQDSPKSLTGDQLYSALLKTEDQTTASALLRDQKQLITKSLWIRLILEATRTSNAGNNTRAMVVLGLAECVAKALEDKPRLAYTYFRMGSVRSLEGDFRGAIDSNLRSKASVWCPVIWVTLLVGRGTR